MPHHIENLRIHAYRRLTDLELTGFGRLNLFVGANNTGKTSLLESLALFAKPLQMQTWVATARLRGGVAPLVDALFWMFPRPSAPTDDPRSRSEIRISGGGSHPARAMMATFQTIFRASEKDQEASGAGAENAAEDSPPDFWKGAEISLQCESERGGGGGEAEVDQFQIWEDQRLILTGRRPGPALPLAFITPTSHRDEVRLHAQLTAATLNGSKHSVVEVVRRIDPEVRRIDILSPNGRSPSIWVDSSRLGYTPITTFGDGVRRVLATALALIQAQGGALLIDEVETAVHRDALKGFYQWLFEAAEHYDVQIFATTHSLEAVDEMMDAARDSLAELVSFRLPTPNRGERLARYSGETLYDLRSGGLEVR